MLENLQYQKDTVTDENVCINGTRNGVYISVPLNSDNTDYSEIMRQVEAGDLTIADAD
jgi:SepF-like predicted cell division protein (DUF552 family)